MVETKLGRLSKKELLGIRQSRDPVEAFLNRLPPPTPSRLQVNWAEDGQQWTGFRYGGDEKETDLVPYPLREFNEDLLTAHKATGCLRKTTDDGRTTTLLVWSGEVIYRNPST